MSELKHPEKCHEFRTDCQTLQLYWCAPTCLIGIVHWRCRNITWLCPRCQALWPVTRSRYKLLPFPVWFILLRSNRRNWNQRFHIDSPTSPTQDQRLRLVIKDKSCGVAQKISFPAGQPPPLEALGLQFTNSLVKYPFTTTFSTPLLPKKGKPRRIWLFHVTQDLVTHHFYKFTKICKRGHKFETYKTCIHLSYAFLRKMNNQ